MNLEFSLEESVFASKNSENIHVFLIYDIAKKTLLNLRISKSKSSRVDRIRTISSAIKKKLPRLKESEIFFINNKSYIFSSDINSSFKNYADLVSSTKNTKVMTDFISFFLNIPENESLKSNVILKLFNASLIESEFSGLKEEFVSFLTIDFDKEKQILSKKFETIFYKRKRIAYLEELNWLQQQQQQLLIDEKAEKDILENLLFAFTIKSKKFEEVKESDDFNVKYTSFFVPNSLEIEIIFRNASISVTKKPDYFASLFKFSFFCLYYLGLDPDEIFIVRKSDLLMIAHNKQIMLNLNENKTITRTILTDTRERFVLLEKDLNIVFQDSDQIVHTNCDKHFSKKNFYFILNKDLKTISEAFFPNTFKVESLKNSAFIRLLDSYPNFYVSKEFKITDSFTKRLEKLYQKKVL